MHRVAVVGLLISFATSALWASEPRAFTYSIVARDARTGELGVAVQSHWFSVGSVVPWAQSGVGAVATQSMADPSYGPVGLALMQAGRPAPDALKGLVEADAGRDLRQVAFVDAQGRVAAHTGASCVPAAGHEVGEGFSVQANLMDKPTVWPAMATAYKEARGDLAERLLAALEAAEREGGDLRGKQSAAILIVKGTPSGKPWADKLFDLRVEDDPAPLVELRRLVNLQRAYHHVAAGDEATAAGTIDEALREYAEAAKLAPEVLELPYWQAVTLASAGHLDKALPVFKAVFARETRWVELTSRLVKVGLLQADAAALDQILAQAPRE